MAGTSLCEPGCVDAKITCCCVGDEAHAREILLHEERATCQAKTLLLGIVNMCSF